LHNLLKAITLEIPPLRDRRQDIMPCVLGLARRLQGADKALPNMATEVAQLLKGYAWPGNIEEMEQVLAHALQNLEGGTITMSSLPPELMNQAGS
jgi:DNA-binding NtrC family response regulator